VIGKLQFKHALAAEKSDTNKIKNIKNVTRCGDSRLGKQGRDDSIKQFSIQPTLHIFNGEKICKVELCTELLCYHTYLVSLLFADLLSPHLATFFVSALECRDIMLEA